VPWRDTDAAGVVWFANFLGYVEMGEVALVQSRGWSVPDVFRRHQIAMPRTNLSISYRLPARFDDVLDVGLAVDSVTERRVQYAFEIRQRDSGQLVAEGSLEVACVDAATFKGRPFPDEVRAVFESLQRPADSPAT
jgi:acyl-CoA thioester hydrolase